MLFVFFFQAEDGIRDLVRSRGLGDVYKRQEQAGDGERSVRGDDEEVGIKIGARRGEICRRRVAVSYTHLTLPTSDLV